MKDDAQLIDEALAGVSASFGQLVAKYQDRLYNTLVHVLGSRDDAYDVAQDAFVQAFLKLESFQRSSAFYTWLYRIAVNLAISQRRRRKTTGSLDDGKQQTGDEPAGRADPPNARIEQRERAQQVQAALATLSDDHRTILILREIDGCCYETIAQMLDLPVGTVRSRLHRARMELRDQLKGVLQEDLK